MDAEKRLLKDLVGVKLQVRRLGDSGFFLDFKVSRYCEVYSFWIFDDPKYKISKGYKQN